jgi:hypothetical protein
MLSYKNQREKAINKAKKREDDARRIEELRQRQLAYESRQAREQERRREDRDRREADVRKRGREHRRRRDANVQRRQPSLLESLKRGRGSKIISESDEEDGHVNVCLVFTPATASAPVVSASVQTGADTTGLSVAVTTAAAAAAAAV